MKKRFVPFLVLLFLWSATIAQQDAMKKFTRAYYRSNPFEMTFGKFVEHVMLDPTLSSRVRSPRTDTSLFIFSATYTSFNPFQFKPARVDVALLEQNIQLYEGRPQGDTIMLYVIIAHGDSTGSGLSEIKKEYDRITRRNKRIFFNAKEESIGEDGVDGMITNFFVSYAQLSPVSVEWISGLGSRPLLRLTMRIRNRGNETVLPMSLYDSQ
ncbi:MAG: hypothetical protein ABWZ25_01100 [Chitinophagaceae bacterium]